eukprot:9125337-Pyramimonas_sp.AAC.2
MKACLGTSLRMDWLEGHDGDTTRARTMMPSRTISRILSENLSSTNGKNCSSPNILTEQLTQPGWNGIPDPESVSYTHLRAHETGAYL